MRTIFVLLGLVLMVTSARAGCSCQCVNGQMQALCESAIDIRPICPPTICGIVPPSIRPIETPMIPPIGTRSCRKEQVQNRYTGMYEWQTICQ